MRSPKDSGNALNVQAEAPNTRPPGPDLRFAQIPARAIRSPDISAGEFRILAAVALHCAGERGGWPKQQTIADFLGITRETVSRAIARLRSAGVLEVVQRYRKDGGQRENVYYVPTDAKIDPQDLVDDDEGDTPPAPPPVTRSSHPPVTSEGGRPVTSVITPTKDEQTIGTYPPNPLPGAELKEVLEEIWDAWPADGRRRSSGRDKCLEILRKASERFPLADIRAAAIAYAASRPKFGTALSKWLRESMFESWIPKQATAGAHGSQPKTTAGIKPPTEQGEKLLRVLIATWGELTIAQWFSDIAWEATTLRTRNGFEAQSLGTRFGGIIREHGFQVV